MKHKHNNQGFHLSFLVLAVAVLAVIGLVGWKVFSNNKSNTSSTAPSSGAQNSASTTGKISNIDTSKLSLDQSAATSDPIGDKNGPFFHSVYTATATDGIHFTATDNKIAEHASVPDVIKLPSGQLVFYAVDGGGRSKSGVLIGVSDDNGKTWKTGSAQFTSSQDGQAGADPEAVMSDNGQLRLYYVVFPSKPTPGQPPGTDTVNKVYSATSTDGIHFTQEQGVRFEYAQITDPDVIKIGSTWFMYSAQGQTQLYATSTDAGGSFSYKGVVRATGAVSKTVSLSDGSYRQFYCGKGGIVSETSKDGINWNSGVVSLTSAASQITCDPSPVQLDTNNWLMVYKVSN
ncbi:MAG: exo-alpha-sialidase [bacterium]|nr:exo-alpha-sialidase [bacterium]